MPKATPRRSGLLTASTSTAPLATTASRLSESCGAAAGWQGGQRARRAWNRAAHGLPYWPPPAHSIRTKRGLYRHPETRRTLSTSKSGGNPPPVPAAVALPPPAATRSCFSARTMALKEEPLRTCAQAAGARQGRWGQPEGGCTRCGRLDTVEVCGGGPTRRVVAAPRPRPSLHPPAVCCGRRARWAARRAAQRCPSLPGSGCRWYRQQAGCRRRRHGTAAGRCPLAQQPPGCWWRRPAAPPCQRHQPPRCSCSCRRCPHCCHRPQLPPHQPASAGHPAPPAAHGPPPAAPAPAGAPSPRCQSRAPAARSPEPAAPAPRPAAPPRLPACGVEKRWLCL